MRALPAPAAPAPRARAVGPRSCAAWSPSMSSPVPAVAAGCASSPPCRIPSPGRPSSPAPSSRQAPPHPRPLPSRHGRRPRPVLAPAPPSRPAPPPPSALPRCTPLLAPCPCPSAQEDHAGRTRSLGPPSPSRSARCPSRCPQPAHPRVGRGDQILVCISCAERDKTCRAHLRRRGIGRPRRI